jgi:hypothetical protein
VQIRARVYYTQRQYRLCPSVAGAATADTNPTRPRPVRYRQSHPHVGCTGVADSLGAPLERLCYQHRYHPKVLDARGVLKLIDFTHAKAVVDDGELSHLRSCGGSLSHLRSCGGLLSCAAQPCHRLFRRGRSAGML